MMQLVFEFGAEEIEPVIATIHLAVGRAPYSVKCLRKDDDTFEPTEDSLLSAALKIKESAIASFSLHTDNGLIRYGLVTSPFYHGEQLSCYLGTIEYLGEDYEPLWNLIVSVPGLSVACLGFEEGVELEDRALSIDTFPWNSWPLVIGALRDPLGSQQWVIREGPEMRWFAKVS